MKKLFSIFNRFLFFLFSDVIYYNFLFLINSIRFKRRYYFLNILSPCTFNEKINYLKNKSITKKSQYSDKIRIKDFVQVKGLFFPRTLKVFESEEDLLSFDFRAELLKEGFVIKANHGSGMNIIVGKGLTLSAKQLKLITKWFNCPSHLNSRERHYEKIPKKVFLEELLADNINDFKVHSFNNVPRFIQIDSDRFSHHKRDIYDAEWNSLCLEYVYPKSNLKMIRPNLLTRILEITRELQIIVNEPYVRCDFYINRDKIYLGEITFHPEGGVGPFDSYEADEYFGSFLNL